MGFPLGLDIECKCGEICFRAGSYSGFHIWRKMLAELAGVDLEKLWIENSIKKRNRKEPFFELLNHSDCDGTLSPSECKRLLEDFDSLRKKLYTPKNLEDVWNKIFGKLEPDEWWLKHFEKWHNAIRHCTQQKCTLKFC